MSNKEAKELLKSLIMGTFSAVKSVVSSSTSASTSRISLLQAKTEAPNEMGCYKIYCDGLKYVGKAEDGIRKRFVQYYNGTTAHYKSGRLIYENRDNITVSWVVLSSPAECRRVERQWIEAYKPDWNTQSGWGHD